MTPGTARIAATAASAAWSAGRLILRQDQEVAAGHRPLHAERVLAEELAVHHRDAPVAPAVELLAGLVPVAEEAEQAADLDRLLAGARPL